MKMRLHQSAGWRLRDAPFPFQVTYHTPLTDLPRFLSTILARFQISEGVVWIELIVFEPRELIWYLRGRGFVCDQGQLNRAVIQAESESEVAELLECVLGQWTDFAFIPLHGDFALYADHDEYVTIFAASAESLSLLRQDMEHEGFKTVTDWTWTGPRSPGIVEEREANG
jgi:hypothetical protein